MYAKKVQTLITICAATLLSASPRPLDHSQTPLGPDTDHKTDQLIVFYQYRYDNQALNLHSAFFSRRGVTSGAEGKGSGPEYMA